jgi:hypothetical protein
MSTEHKDGGPAFPNFAVNLSGLKHDQPGMTLRDWFAGQALASAGSSSLDAVRIAKACYERADAMIAAREKGGGNE